MIERLPGGMMVVPVLSCAGFATFFADTPQLFGWFMGARFTGALPHLAVLFVGIGAGILLGMQSGRRLRETPLGAEMFAGIATLSSSPR